MSDLPPPSANPPPPLVPPSAAQGQGPGSVGYRVVAVGQPPARLEGVYYSAGLVILLSIVTFGIWTFLWTFRTSEDLKRYNGDGLGGVIGLVVLFVFSPILMFTIPNEIEKLYQRDGQRSPISTVWGLWVLLPLLGPFIWYLKVQRSLNDFWLSKGTQPA
jgi:Domain of unknown function (DUF4234)